MSPDSFPCANCGEPSTDTRVLVPVCSSCARHVDAKLQRFDQQQAHQRLLFQEHLRVELLETRMPKPSETPRDSSS